MAAREREQLPLAPSSLGEAAAPASGLLESPGSTPPGAPGALQEATEGEVRRGWLAVHEGDPQRKRSLLCVLRDGRLSCFVDDAAAEEGALAEHSMRAERCWVQRAEDLVVRVSYGNYCWSLCADSAADAEAWLQALVASGARHGGSPGSTPVVGRKMHARRRTMVQMQQHDGPAGAGAGGAGGDDHDSRPNVRRCEACDAALQARTEHICWEGFLVKKGNPAAPSLNLWKRRWFRICPGQVNYRRHATSAEVLGTIPLYLRRVTPYEERARKRLIAIVPPDDRQRTFIVSTESDAERDQLMRRLKHAVQACNRIRLFEACRDGDEDTVANTLASLDDQEVFRLLHSVNSEGDSVLHVAATAGVEAVAKMLIRAGADVHAPNLQLNQPIHLASRWDHISVVRALLNAGADVSAPGRCERTPLHYAGSSALVELLIERGAGLDDEGIFGMTPLMQAVRHGNFESSRALLERRADVNARSWQTGYTALAHAAKEGRAAMVALLMQHGANPDVSSLGSMRALHIAAARGHVHCVQNLLDGGAAVDARTKSGLTPLAMAASGKDSVTPASSSVPDADAGASPSPAAGPSSPPGEDDGGKPVDKGEPRFAQCATILIARGADIHATDQFGRLALHYSAEAGNPHTLLTLCDAGSDPNVTDHSGCTALEYVERKIKKGAEYLVNYHELIRCQEILEANGALRRLHRELPVEVDTDEIKFTRSNQGTYRLRAGTLDKIVERLTHHRLVADDDVRAWCLWYPKFMTRAELLGKLAARFREPAPESTARSFSSDPSSTGGSSRRLSERIGAIADNPIQVAVVRFLDIWMDAVPKDFTVFWAKLRAADRARAAAAAADAAAAGEEGDGRRRAMSAVAEGLVDEMVSDSDSSSSDSESDDRDEDAAAAEPDDADQDDQDGQAEHKATDDGDDDEQHFHDTLLEMFSAGSDIIAHSARRHSALHVHSAAVTAGISLPAALAAASRSSSGQGPAVEADDGAGAHRDVVGRAAEMAAAAARGKAPEDGGESGGGDGEAPAADDAAGTAASAVEHAVMAVAEEGRTLFSALSRKSLRIPSRRLQARFARRASAQQGVSAEESHYEEVALFLMSMAQTAQLSRKAQQMLVGSEPAAPEALPGILSFPATRVAKQLTLVTHNLFTQIPQEEFLFGRFEHPHESAPCFLRWRRWFQRCNLWVVGELLQHEEVSQRAAALQAFITVADTLHDPLKNYDSLMAIMAGLNSNAIYRLKHTWARLDKKTTKKWAQLQNLAASGAKGLTKQDKIPEDVPHMPYIGLYCTQLINLAELPTKLEDAPDLVNFSKFRELGKVAARIRAAQQTRYIYELDHEVQTMLHKEHAIKDFDEAYDRSLELEPRGS